MRAASYAEVGVTADTELVAESVYLHGIVLLGGSAAGEVTLYDGPIAGGKKLARLKAGIGLVSQMMLPCPVRATTSIRAVVTGTAGVAGIYYGK